MENTFNYLKTNKHMPASTYRYVNLVKNCSYDASKGLVNTIGFSYLAKNDPNAMMQALQYGPVTAAVASSNYVFQFYSSGVLTDTACGTAINHAVLIVGYGNDTDGTPYWTVKNTWGEKWGEYGYIRILRDLTPGGPGVCGINTYVIMPLISSSVTLPQSTSPSYLNEIYVASSDPSSFGLYTQATCAASLAVAGIATLTF